MLNFSKISINNFQQFAISAQRVLSFKPYSYCKQLFFSTTPIKLWTHYKAEYRFY